MLTTFLERTQQTHTNALSAHVVAGSAQYSGYIDTMKNSLIRLGQSPDNASRIAVGNAWQMLNRQAQMLSYQNTFWGMSIIIACLIPLPFIMRRPPRSRATEEPVGGH
jgi:DHA2 family multidrug resistance protein